MANCAQRRQMMREQTEKSKALMAGYTRQETGRTLVKNGITPRDLEKSYEEGRQDGFRQAADPVIKCCYAGIILALHDAYGFGAKRAFRAIKAVDERIVWALDHSELCDEVLKKTGLKLDLDAPFGRVERMGRSGKK